MKQIPGGVTAPKGFRAWGVHCGVKSKKADKKDLALILSDQECAAAAVYTMNRVKAAPLYVTMEHLEDGTAWGVAANSGNANACCPMSHEYAEEMARLAARATGRAPADFVVASTGVIGQVLPIEPIENSVAALTSALSKEGGTDAAEAIMTTDTIKKEIAVQIEVGGKTVTIGGIAKGSGMIHPNMATMLGFLTTDAAVSPEMLQCVVKEAADVSFNMVSVDGDTSTNDTLVVLASGKAGNQEITEKSEDYQAFLEGLVFVSREISKLLAGDGEGATKLLICKVSGAKTLADAKGVAKSVICSSLLKAAMFGADANWGRVLCAIGYSGCDVDISKVDVAFRSAKGAVTVCVDGAGIEFSEEKAKEILLEKEIDILVDLKDGSFDAEAYGCDLTYDYVKINGDYRT